MTKYSRYIPLPTSQEIYETWCYTLNRLKHFSLKKNTSYFLNDTFYTQRKQTAIFGGKIRSGKSDKKAYRTRINIGYLRLRYGI